MRGTHIVIKVTHEFLEDPHAVRRGYDAWALLLARSLDLGTDEESPLGNARTPRKGRKKGTA